MRKITSVKSSSKAPVRGLAPVSCALLTKIASELYATQLSQIKIWRADDADLPRIRDFCIDEAIGLCEKVKYQYDRMYGDADD